MDLWFPLLMQKYVNYPVLMILQKVAVQSCAPSFPQFIKTADKLSFHIT